MKLFRQESGLYMLEVSENLPSEFVHLIRDSIKLLCILITYQLLIFSKDKSTTLLQTFELCSYSIIGLSMYHLIINRIIHFV